MGNILNNNFNNLKLQFNLDEYWDFFVCKENDMGGQNSQAVLDEKCLISYIDMENGKCISGNDIQSLDQYVWESALTTSDYVLSNIGLTGFDNGLMTFRKDRIDNKKFLELYLKSEYNVQEEKNLRLHAVSGSTLTYDYSLEITDGEAKLKGGFFQGFFKTECDKFAILPSVFENGDTWNLEFVLKKEDYEEKDNTLNSTHPNNKGIFFYLGTRAENKWIYEYEEDTETNTQFNSEYYWEKSVNDYIDFSDLFTTDEDDEFFNLFDGDKKNDEYDYLEDDIDISNVEMDTDSGINIKENGEYYIDTNNKFLTFDRTCDGFNVNTWEEGDIARYYGKRNSFQGNLFLLMNRTCSGYNVNTIEDYKNTYKKEYNIYKDLYNNALGFRITDNGAIGYRYMTLDCDSETKITTKEGYSFDGVIKEGEWTVIDVTLQASEKKMRMYFYVNGKLVFVTDEMDKLNLRALHELQEKQETVPFNISIGGGTQGLADTILPNYMDKPSRLYPLEENFSGTFIGSFKSFKFYNCNIGYESINNNFAFEKSKLK